MTPATMSGNDTNHTVGMEFCPPNITIGQVWLEQGWSPCFLDTVSISVIAAFLLVFGTAQLCMYRRYGTRNDAVAPSRHYGAQLLLHGLLPCVELIRFALLTTTAYDGADGQHAPIAGYQILHAGLTLCVYGALAGLLSAERNRLLPATPSQGHGLVLLFSWTLLFVVDNLELINMRSGAWTDVAAVRTRVELGLFGVRYVMGLYLFVVGLKAPGIARVQATGENGGNYDRLDSSGAASATTTSGVSIQQYS